MKVEVEVDVDDIETKTADDRGRVNLGVDYAGDDVRVAVVEVVDDE